MARITVVTDAWHPQVNGVVRSLENTIAEMQKMGHEIMLVTPEDAGALGAIDGGLYRVEDDGRLRAAAPGEDGTGTLVQGSIERSNVEMSSEMVQLMLVQRAYAANAQIVQAADQLMAIANGLRRS